jgi:NADH-quinone oxidoreductase subunit J
MNLPQIIFLVTAAVTLFGAVMTVTSRRMVHSALWLVLTLLGVGAIYVLLQVGFFAVVQVLVYVGAIAILVLFAVMLTHRSMNDSGSQTNRYWISTLLITLIVGMLVTFAFLNWPAASFAMDPMTGPEMDIAQLGLELVSLQGYLIPFEVTSILLLAALVGAIYVASDHKEK